MARERKFSQVELFQLVENVLLNVGYEGLTFGVLADKLQISRGALYKYYENKEDLVLDFMIHKMELFFDELKQLESITSFHKQFDYIFDVMFKYSTIVQLLAKVHLNPFEKNENIAKNKKKMDQFHLEIYDKLHSFISLGKQEGIVKQELPDRLLLAMIFQSVIMPNHFQIEKEEWVKSIKHILGYGMFNN